MLNTWNYSYFKVDDRDFYPDEIEFSDFTADDDSLPSAALIQAQHRCTMTLSFAINTIGAGLVCLFGLVGNFLSILVIGDDPKASVVTVLLLQALAVADNFFLAVWLVQFSINDLVQFVDEGAWTYRSVGWNYLRLYTYPLVFVGQSATIGLTVLVAGNRYVAVCKPYHASTYCNLRLTRFAVAAVFISAVVYNLPHFFEAEMQLIPSANGSNGRYMYHVYFLFTYLFTKFISQYKHKYNIMREEYWNYILSRPN